MPQFGLYVHFAFCVRKCAYCDFNSMVGAPPERDRYLAALLHEARRLPRKRVQTVYFGGGTPTVYSPDQLASVLGALRSTLDIAADAEVTVEANPGTVTRAGLQALRGAGFNRLSLGIQSLDDGELRLLGRIHSADDARRAADDARAGGFENLSIDLMRGLPGQTLAGWQANAEAALTLGPDHISAYGLTLEPGTRLRDAVQRGEIPQPEGSGDPDWVRWTADRFGAAGLARYEISNFARQGFESRHNINYWNNREYLGIGAGAWSYVDGVRARNIANPAEYAAAVEAGELLVAESERLDAESALGETIMLGTRLVEGISVGDLQARFGVDVNEKHRATIARMVDAGLMVDDPSRLRLTFEGLLVQNAAAVEFLA